MSTAMDVSDQNIDVALPAQHGPDGRRDVALGQGPVAT
jgi:hypothetical protein